jgi:predicted HicB family RNase H-like nuclease
MNKTSHLCVKVSPELHNNIRRIAVLKKMSLSDYLRDVLRKVIIQDLTKATKVTKKKK